MREDERRGDLALIFSLLVDEPNSNGQNCEEYQISATTSCKTAEFAWESEIARQDYTLCGRITQAEAGNTNFSI